MKLSTTLLTAMLATITLGAVSCTKDMELSTPEEREQLKQNHPLVPSDNCPACGMG
jgi:hypothetical protein